MINFGNLVKLSLIKFNFNFNFNGNLTSNADKIDKKGIKIILVVFTVFIFIVISGLIGIGSLITSTINSMGEVAEEYNRQQKYVQSLPILITIEYQDKYFNPQIKTFSGMTARVIQHECDHTQGVLYLDHLKPLTKKIMESNLKKIANGSITTGYPMKFI